MLKGINPGELDILLTIEQPSRSKNSIGEYESTWTSYKQVFGKREWKSGGEKIEALQETGLDDVNYTVRYDSGLTTLMRFKQEQETTYFYIRNVKSSRREGISFITAERRDNQ